MSINELSLEHMASWSWLVKISFIALVILLFSLLFFIYDVKPMQQRIHEEKLKEASLFDAFYKKSNAAASLTIYQRQAEQMRNDNVLLIQQLPRVWNIPQMIQTLSTIGASRGLVLRTIKPQTEIGSPGYIILPIRISAQGSYHQLGRFIADITQFKPIIVVDSFTLQPASANVTSDLSGPDEQLQMDFTVHIYRQAPSQNTAAIQPREPPLPLTPLASLPKAPAMPYNYPSNRSPFSVPVTTLATPSINQIDLSTQRYPLSALTMAGTLTHDKHIWALIVTPDGQVQRVRVGDTLGLEKNRIIAITPTEITLNANKTDSSNSTSTLVYLRLKLEGN